MRRPIETTAMLAIAFAALVFAGCAPDRRVSVTALPGPPGSELSGDHIELPLGTALVVTATPKDKDATAELVGDAVAKPLPTPTKNRFVIVGSAVGTGALDVRVWDGTAKTLSVHVFE